MINRKNVLVCLIIFCGILVLLLFVNDSMYTDLVFSEESGFYGEPFELALYAPPGTEIYYTLDGSDPDENAIKYTQPIMITDASWDENVYSMRTDVSTGFLSEEIAMYSRNDPLYKAPDYNIDKCTVVRGVYRDADGNLSDIKTEVYFVDYDKKAGYDNLNVISIVTDPENLFDYESGIYVLGQANDNFMIDREGRWNASTWWWWFGNYNQSGPEWERSANIKLFDGGRNLLLNKTCGIRIQGGGSRGRLPKSMNLYAREQYDGEGRFYIDLFDTDYMADKVTLFAGGDDTVAKLRDMLMARLSDGRSFATMHFVPCALFLDGEYWGVYWITEKYDDVYLGHYYNVDKDNVIMIKTREAEEGEEYYDLYEEMMSFMTDADLSDDDNYQYACELIDMQSYIDYYAAEIYIGRCIDWPSDNEALWRVCDTGDTEYEDGRWRWMLFDVNSGGLSAYLTDADTILDTMNMSAMFYNLCQNDNFKKQFTITLMDLVNTSFASENADAVISDYIALMKEPLNMHYKRFFGSENSIDFLGAVADIQSFLDNRKPYIVQYLKNDFGLNGTLAPVEIEINDPASGSIVLNTINPSFDTDGKWRGEYYTDYPIALSAAANEGYRFVGWEINGSADSGMMHEADIDVPVPAEGISVKGIFEKTPK